MLGWSFGSRERCDACWQVLRLLGLPEADLRLVTKDRDAARIHVSFMGKIFLPEALRERIAGTQWTHVVAFRPTGEYRKPHLILMGLHNIVLRPQVWCCGRLRTHMILAYQC